MVLCSCCITFFSFQIRNGKGNYKGREQGGQIEGVACNFIVYVLGPFGGDGFGLFSGETLAPILATIYGKEGIIYDM